MADKETELLLLLKNRNFHELHDKLENFWSQEKNIKRKTFLQALIQLSVALHHYDLNNINGFQILCDKAKSKLKISFNNNPEIVLELLKDQLFLIK